MNNPRVYQWRDVGGRSLEVLRIEPSPTGFDVRADIVHAADTPFAATYDWMLDQSWRTVGLRLSVRGDETRTMSIERSGDASWRVDGRERADLSGCEEIDLSITPFCNTLALLRFGAPPGGAGELTTLYVQFPDLSLTSSRQRYEQIGRTEFLYVDLGLYSGFTAKLTVDADGFVRNYEKLFVRIDDMS